VRKVILIAIAVLVIVSLGSTIVYSSTTPDGGDSEECILYCLANPCASENGCGNKCNACPTGQGCNYDDICANYNIKIKDITINYEPEGGSRQTLTTLTENQDVVIDIDYSNDDAPELRQFNMLLVKYESLLSDIVGKSVGSGEIIINRDDAYAEEDWDGYVRTTWNTGIGITEDSTKISLCAYANLDSNYDSDNIWSAISGTTNYLSHFCKEYELLDGDDDGDGQNVPSDCDDDDADIYLDALEICDYKDNNCNDEIDENNICADVDGDGDGYYGIFDVKQYSGSKSDEILLGNTQYVTENFDLPIPLDSVGDTKIIVYAKGSDSSYCAGSNFLFRLNQNELSMISSLDDFDQSYSWKTFDLDVMYLQQKNILDLLYYCNLDGPDCPGPQNCRSGCFSAIRLDCDLDIALDSNNNPLMYLQITPKELDCDDTDPNVYFGAEEICDGKDTDCDGVTPVTEIDNDGDGFSECQGDVDDTDPLVTGVIEVCNDNWDNDWDGYTDCFDSDCFDDCQVDVSPTCSPETRIELDTDSISVGGNAHLNEIFNSVTGWMEQMEFSGDDPVYMDVDLGALNIISKVVFRFDNNAYPLDYILAVSEDKINWKLIKYALDNGADTITSRFTPTKARYIRMLTTGSNYQSGYIIEGDSTSGYRDKLNPDDASGGNSEDDYFYKAIDVYSCDCSTETCTSVCGDGTCNVDEDCETCESDCGVCPECTSAVDCDDGNSCTIDTCDTEECIQTPITLCDSVNGDGCCPAGCDESTDSDCIVCGSNIVEAIPTWRIFMTQGGYTTNLGGLDGADEICMREAVNLDSTKNSKWFAFLSTSSVNVKDRLTEGEFYNMNNVKMADSIDDLFDDHLTEGSQPMYDIFGIYNSNNVLTGSRSNGLRTGDTCNSWTSSSSFSSHMGISYSTVYWISRNSWTCSDQYQNKVSIYCVEVEKYNTIEICDANEICVAEECVSSAPDLIVKEINLNPLSPIEDGDLTITPVIENIGHSPTEEFKVSIYKSTTSTLPLTLGSGSPDTLLGEGTISSLNPSESASIDVKWENIKIDNIVDGQNIKICVYADSEDTITESNEVDSSNLIKTLLGVSVVDNVGCMAVTLQYDDDGDGHIDDCDDTDGDVYQLLDGYPDVDGDTYTTGAVQELCSGTALPAGYLAITAVDCNDNDGTINPGATEICDNVDNNCNGQTDEGLTQSCSNACGSGTETCNAGSWEGCTARQPSTEICDNADNDCDGVIDEEGAQNCQTYYLDEDEDDYGLDTNSKCLCSSSGLYTASVSGDCNDNNNLINPGATEICDGADNNCDGVIDEEGAQNCQTYYLDEDEDGDGNSTDYKCLCLAEGLYSSPNNLDCDDNDEYINTGALELCDGADNDCDGSIDEGLTQTCSTACGSGTETCNTGSWEGCTAQQPGTEICDGADNNCDGVIDEEGAQNCQTYYLDEDEDGDGNSTDYKCLCLAEGLYSSPNNLDCNDNDADIYLGATEICADEIDNDCDGDTDEIDCKCSVDSDCNDGLFCNGVETCDTSFVCQPGTSVICDDDVACTHDSCDSTEDACVFDTSNCECVDDDGCSENFICVDNECISEDTDGDGVMDSDDACENTVSEYVGENGCDLGDFNEDTEINVGDIDLLVIAILGGDDDLLYDINDDGIISDGDINMLVSFILYGNYNGGGG
jgi:hypothetical protein